MISVHFSSTLNSCTSRPYLIDIVIIMSVDFSTEWDIEKYKSPFESEEHWELRKNFLVAHKNKYAEDKLVCLAQVFFNIELLGCRYPNETMKLVSELSEGIADNYRDVKRQKIQRTFVKASDAAGAKIKGLSSVPTMPDASKQNPSLSVLTTKTHQTSVSVNIEHEGVISRTAMNFTNTKELNCLLKDLVIMKTLDEDFFSDGTSIIQRSFSKKNIKPEYRITQLKQEKDKIVWECIFSANGFELARALAASKQISRKAANEAFLHSLQEICYTVEEKSKFVNSGSTIGKDGDLTSQEVKVSATSVGGKMMKLMGWAGGGLGAMEQGRLEPVAVQERVQRSGFGTNIPKPQLMKGLNQKLAAYAREETHCDLVFSNDFSKDERAELHRLAQKYHLKSHSYGAGNDRHLVISKHVRNHSSLVTLLLGCGGENERYKLTPPLNSMYE